MYYKAILVFQFLRGSCFSMFSVLRSVLSTIASLSITIMLGIALYVLRGFMGSDYPFLNFNLYSLKWRQILILQNHTLIMYTSYKYRPLH
jgi:hypothetical protein